MKKIRLHPTFLFWKLERFWNNPESGGLGTERRRINNLKSHGNQSRSLRRTKTRHSTSNVKKLQKKNQEGNITVNADLNLNGKNQQILCYSKLYRPTVLLRVLVSVIFNYVFTIINPCFISKKVNYKQLVNVRSVTTLKISSRHLISLWRTDDLKGDSRT